MTRHLLRLMWNRRGANALVGLELLVTFLVLFALAAMAVQALHRARSPLGFEPRGVWGVTLDNGRGRVVPVEDNPVIERMLAELRRLAPVEAAAAAAWLPYRQASWTTGWEEGGRTADVAVHVVSDAFAETMGVGLAAGRWFGRQDYGDPRRAVVVNRRLATELFGDEDPVGREIAGENPAAESLPLRVIGVVPDYRPHGELAEPRAAAFLRALFHPPPNDREFAAEDYLSALVIRMAPGTPPAFEETLLERLRAVEPGWRFAVRPLEQERAAYLRQRLAPLAVTGLIAGFLLLMVALGLTGVLWQSVTARTRELGLRRAKGATRARIRRQIVGEVLLLTLAAVLVGAALVAQLPLAGWLPTVRGGVLAAALALSALGIALLAAAAALYPSWLATRVEPTEALHHE